MKDLIIPILTLLFMIFIFGCFICAHIELKKEQPMRDEEEIIITRKEYNNLIKNQKK